MSDLADEIPVLLSTHIVEDIEATCPRLVIIDRGSLLFDGPPGELLRRADGNLWRLPTDQEVPEGAQKIGHRAGEGGRDFHLLYAEAPPAGAEPEQPNLEEAAAAFLHVSLQELAGGAPDTASQNPPEIDAEIDAEARA